MEEWRELTVTVIIALILWFLISKLNSMLVSFREGKRKLVRESDIPEEPNISTPETSLAAIEPDNVHQQGTKSSYLEDEQPTSGEQKALLESLHAQEDDEDDDWEGVECTELDEAFSAATAFVATAASDRLSQKVSSDIQLQLYGLYKVATEGPCSVPQPSALKISARAKWNAWQRLGAMPAEEAMQKYIALVTELYPTWLSGSISKKKKESGDNSSSSKGTMGPVFSSFVYEEHADHEIRMDAIHASAREGETTNLIKYIEDGISVNVRDSEDRTPLHWAVDRGHFSNVELLISKGADLNVQDDEGQTPLHYAVVCEREAIAKLLVEHNASQDIKDNDGNTPSDLCDSSWLWMHSGNK
ncbi:acyl-CoA-binding domain-containing protein 1-like isoform X2 [Aristolochia californica]|uniref:acyl-CoA-binding domain-containing protein 1-like isoform X2 n=1 Tax=Aristolochia californica TaxID=171875 RepID=UPI0035DB8679